VCKWDGCERCLKKGAGASVCDLGGNGEVVVGSNRLSEIKVREVA